MVAASVSDLFAAVERREPFVNPDGRSSARFERVWIGGSPHIVKYSHVDDDFMLRVSGDLHCRVVRAWSAGLLDSAPTLIEHAIVGAAAGVGRNGWGVALLMRDVSSDLFAPGEAVIRVEDHDRYLDHLAGWCAATWGFRDESPDGPWLLPYPSRWAWFGHAALDGERALGWPERVPAIAAQGWQRFAERTPPGLAAAIDDLRREVSPLSDALRTTPSCLLHGDPKASNAGISADGRTVLIDWAYVGEGPACHELGWHLALDRAKLPASKESIIAAFRQALERHGVATDGWWDRQLALALLGTVVQFGWEKALGDEHELRWWCAAAEEGLKWL